MKPIVFLITAIVLGILLFKVSFAGEPAAVNGKTYSVQILLSKTHLQPEDAMFKGIKDIEEEVCTGYYKYKYVTGKTTNIEEATATRVKMIDAGFNGAFVVPYKDGSRAWTKNETTWNTKCNTQPAKCETPSAASTASAATTTGTTTTTTTATNWTNKPKSHSSIYGTGNTVQQTEPEFPGGDAGLLEYIQKNMKEATQVTAHGQWEHAFIQFKVARTGKVENVKILSGINKDLDNTIATTFRAMPAWKPAAIDGTPIDKDYLLPLDLFVVDKGVTVDTETAIEQ